MIINPAVLPLIYTLPHLVGFCSLDGGDGTDKTDETGRWALCSLW